MYEPWRGSFYPPGLTKARELEYASRQLTAIEINATYYRAQGPASFAKWRDATPEGFVFSLKASRYATNRRVLAEAGESIDRFFASGLHELGDKLGPIVWQLATTMAFDPDDFAAFLKLLPARVQGLRLRHAIEPRHSSFMCSEYLALARRHDVATVFVDSEEFPSFADATGDFIYARLMKTEIRWESGYAPEAIDRWADCARVWADGDEPSALPRLEPLVADKTKPAGAKSPGGRDVFLIYISGAKERAPMAAQATLRALGQTPA